MSSPLTTPEFETLYVGDKNDDDGKVIDSFLHETNAPATPVVNAIVPQALERPKPIGRLLTGTLLLDGSYANTPVMLLPADANRVQIRIDGFSTAEVPGYNDYVNLADENGKSTSATFSWHLRHEKGHTLDEFTGAVWVTIGPISAAFEVSWIAVTM
jgi:hypothetical protein